MSCADRGFEKRELALKAAQFTTVFSFSAKTTETVMDVRVRVVPETDEIFSDVSVATDEGTDVGCLLGCMLGCPEGCIDGAELGCRVG